MQLASLVHKRGDRLDLLCYKIEALLEQSHGDWGEKERFRELKRIFWKVVERPDWKTESIRSGKEDRDMTSFIELIRKLEEMDRCSRNSRVFSVNADRNLSEILCYYCNETGHMQRECPIRQSNKSASRYTAPENLRLPSSRNQRRE